MKSNEHGDTSTTTTTTTTAAAAAAAAEVPHEETSASLGGVAGVGPSGQGERSPAPPQQMITSTDDAPCGTNDMGTNRGGATDEPCETSDMMTTCERGPDEPCGTSDMDDSGMYLQVHPCSDEQVGFKPASFTTQGRKGLRRYRKGLRNAILLRTAKAPEETLPLESNGLVNYMTFAWLSSYMWTVFRHGTGPLAGLKVSQQEGAKLNAQRVGRFWSAEIAERGESGASFGRAIFKSFKTRIIIGAFISLLYALLTLANPIFVIRYFLAYLSECEEVSISTGAPYVLALGVIILLRGVAGAAFWMLNFEAAARIKYGSLALLYAKILRLKSLKDKSVGDIVNLVSNDGQRLWNGIIMGPFVIGGPMILVISCVYGVFFLGPWALLSFVVIVGFFPFAVMMARLSQKLRAKCVRITDKRVGLMVELLTSIKLIKMYAWETSFWRKITDIRSEEKSVLEKSLFVQSVSVGSSMLVPLMASCFTFIGYVGTGNNLTATQAFTFVSLLNTIQASMATLPFALKAISEMVVTTRRIQNVLLMEEVKLYPSISAANTDLVEMRDATFSWHSLGASRDKPDGDTGKESSPGLQEKRKRVLGKGKARDKETASREGLREEKQNLKECAENHRPIFVGPTLQNITFTIKKGDLVGVCGSVASGKTSLIHALLGKMELTSGTVTLSRGTVAYVPQQAWLTHGTLRDNILFGEVYEEKRYNQVIEACALSDDFSSLPSGDATEIGESGSTLSGGQKQRLSLARAAYSSHDLVLLDDPLSAVDVHLARHIFNQCVLSLLRQEGEGGHRRTVVFVSHLIEYMKDCNHILVVKDGMIVEQGTHEELLVRGEENEIGQQDGGESSFSACRGEYMSLLRQHQEHQTSHKSKAGDQHELETMLGDNKIGQQTLKSQEVTLSEPGRLIDEGFPSNTPDVVSDHNSNGLAYKSKVKTSSQFEPSTSKEENKDLSHNCSRLIQEEQADMGALSLSVLHQWILSMGGYPVLALALLIFCLPVAGVTTASWYLSYWIEQGGGVVNGTLFSPRVVDNPNLSCYLLIYASFIPVLIILTLVRSFSLTKTSLHAASSLHNRGFLQILQGPLSFFHATPVGRILNRFSADQDEIDMVLPINVEVFTNNVLQVLAASIAVCYVSPWFAPAMIPLAALFLLLMVIFHVCFRRLKCFDHVTRSPVLAHLEGSVQGLDSVQAYGAQKEFFNRQCKLLDSNCVAVMLFQTASRWLALRLDLVSAGVALITGLLILACWDRLNPALAGLALAFALQMSGLFQFTARLAVETEARFTSVQRILEYCNIKKEEPALVTEPPQKGWPSEGSIQFHNVSLRYHSDAPLALWNVSFDVKPREKIGTVGRSGAGKSSLSVALFRLFELEQGKITVDDTNISNIPLDQLRPTLSIIPQDPVLFAGTLRYNLDPLGQFSDSDLWQALDKCHVSEMVKASEQQLDTLVSEGGRNLSVGERQLLCLARALLRRCKIVILDEATAAVDSETDSRIQETLRVAFKECTMLIIAHRLATVLLCDKILVMDSGRVLEFDTPSNLTSNQSSKFNAMLQVSKHGS